MNNILKGGKAKVTVNGVAVGEFSSYEISTDYDPKDVVDYVESKIPNHQCNQCGENWTWSTNDNKCIVCQGEDITHE